MNRDVQRESRDEQLDRLRAHPDTVGLRAGLREHGTGQVVRPKRRTFPGTISQVPVAREFVTRHLQAVGCPEHVLADFALCVTELVTNAVIHTQSGCDGGYVIVTVRARNGRARVEVADNGPLLRPVPLDDTAFPSESGWGLHLVCAHAARMGRVTWFECLWDEPQAETP